MMIFIHLVHSSFARAFSRKWPASVSDFKLLRVFCLNCTLIAEDGLPASDPVSTANARDIPFLPTRSQKLCAHNSVLYKGGVRFGSVLTFPLYHAVNNLPSGQVT